MCYHISNKTAYAEEVQVRAERMEPEKDAKKANDGENVSGTSGPVEGVEKKKGDESYSVTPATSEDEEEILEEPPEEIVEEPHKKSDKGDVKNTAGFDWYKLTDEDIQRTGGIKNTPIRIRGGVEADRFKKMATPPGPQARRTTEY